MPTSAVAHELHSPFDGLKMPLEAYLRLPEEKPALEYRSGRVVQKPVPNAEHRRISGVITGEFYLFVRTHGGDFGPEGRVFLRSRGEYVVPDAAYWLPGLPSGDDTIPSMVVEVRSPGQGRRDLRQKCLEYRADGALVAWLVDPEAKTVEVFEDGRDGAVLREGTLESPHLPGFTLDLAILFAAPA
jgi:Uma2 family endonuclease